MYSLRSLLSWIASVFLLSVLVNGCQPADESTSSYIRVSGAEHGSDYSFWKGQHLAGGDFYLSAAGDPEDFLYRGNLRSDGTRDGDQDAIIESLARQGVNGIYFQMIRSHGGDGVADHNPFIGNNPANGLNPKILDQWESWFSQLLESGITILLFFYDDSATIWDTGDEVESEERELIHAIVKRYIDFPNIIWAVAEEYAEAFTAERASAIAAEIASADESNRRIAIHKNSGVEFAEFSRDPHIDVFAMQLPAMAPVDMNAAVSDAWARSTGLYTLIMSESPEWGVGLDAQRRAWASAFGGGHVMVYDLAFETPEDHDLIYLSHLRSFVERFGLIDAVPYSRIATGDTLFAMKDLDGGYYAYGRTGIALNGIRSGKYLLTLYNPATGDSETTTEMVDNHKFSLTAGPEYPSDIAAALRPVDVSYGTNVRFPGPDWDVPEVNRSEIDYEALDSIAEDVRGDGCVVLNGQMVYSWGDVTRPLEWASAAKPLLAMLVGYGIQEGVVHSVDQRIVDYGWWLKGDDRAITFRHLINMTSGYARAEPPGEAWAYNDFGPTLLGETLERAFARSVHSVMTGWLQPLQFQDEPGLVTRGGFGLRASVRDACRIGVLWLNEGTWEGSELLSSRIFHSLVRPMVPTGISRTAGRGWNYLMINSYGGPSDQTPFGPGIYGSMLWFNDIVPQSGVPTWPGLPPDAFQANGHYGDKHITVIPSMNLVIASHHSRRAKNDFEPGNDASPMNVYLNRVVDAVSGKRNTDAL